ncbi:hypothetical protein CMV_023186 [Castanea mollissima]|uniref:Uncharacterized protein n=1 Tax=Castanea mollissima TaxID=60419 RepID=A0A8J4V768_9ROSI|nr:hypothetical protein CMV_023186 [Castanea mollissima]
MADSVVTFLLQNLTQLLSQESKLLGGVGDQVRLLQNELSLINVFLQNTEGKRHDNELVKKVVSQIRDVAYEAEDVIDTFIMTVIKHKRRCKLTKLIHSCNRAMSFHEVASKIERINNVIKEIYNNRSKYGIEIAESSGGDTEAEVKLHRRRRYVEEDRVVGFSHDTEGVSPMPKLRKFILKAELKEELLHGLEVNYSSNKDKLKGTLIEDLNGIKAMNDEECKKALFAFLEHIRDHKFKKSLSGFMESIYRKNGQGWQDLDDDELKSLLFKCLENKRYLVVMDNIWEIEAWNEVSVAFPTNSNGSRVLITSRIKEVALHASSLNNSIPQITPYELPYLDEDKSWELFSKKVFGGGTCPQELENLGRQIVKSCHGLPLAIVDRSSCMDILALSYNHLPRRLKPCFLYFGIYPEDFEIPVRQLIRLWIAEGFIRQIGNRNIEDVAEDYLEELIDWSLIQAATKRLDGGVKTCRIHDLLRDLCISESAEEKFLEVCSDIKLSPMSKCRRISIHFANHPYISSYPCESSNIRSVMGFGGVVGLESPLGKGYYLKLLCKSNKLVRVVELSNMAICCVIPKRIENLVLLRYLSISSGVRHVIPNSICNLWNLETLDKRNFKIKYLPEGIWKLQNLRYLYLNGSTSLPRTDNKAGLPNLQVLAGIDLNLNSMRLFARARFPNLRKLGLRSSASGGSIDIDSLVLSLSTIQPLRHLQTLKLCEFIMALRNKISLQLTKITLLDLKGCGPFTWGVLGSLANLRILKVVGCGMLTLDCNESSFCQLEVLKMAKVTDSEWTMEKGAMPRLQRLVIERCNFKTMPLDELWCLSALRDVEVLHPDPELANML